MQTVNEVQLVQRGSHAEQPPVTLSLYEPDGHSQVFDAVIGKRSGQVRQCVALSLQVVQEESHVVQIPVVAARYCPFGHLHSPEVESLGRLSEHVKQSASDTAEQVAQLLSQGSEK